MVKEEEEEQQQQSSKKARVDGSVGEEEAIGERAVARVELVLKLKIDKAKFHCPVCTHPLKPPIFQCAAGHLACGACHGQLPDKDRCYKCSHTGWYSRNIAMEDVVRSTKIVCPYASFGCRSSVTYYDLADHQRGCARALCRCSEPGCAFVGSRLVLARHLAESHSWDAFKIGYGKTKDIRLPEARPRARLVAVEEDRGVFLVSVAALHGVSLACVRANAAAGPQYTCKICVKGSAGAATGKVHAMTVEMEVPSTAAPGETAPAAEAPLVVHPTMWCGTPNKELKLDVTIDKVQA